MLCSPAHATPETHKMLSASRVRFANSPVFLQKRIEELESLVRGVEEKAGIGAPIYPGGGVQFLNRKPKNQTSVSNIIQSVLSLFLLRKHFINITRPKNKISEDFSYSFIYDVIVFPS
jgi:hypothetical protein